MPQLQLKPRELTDLLSAPVAESEIDDLGHLSVPFYEARARTASRRLAAALGLDFDACRAEGLKFRLVDSYSRNLREQFRDAPLVVRGGVLAADEDRLRFYLELVNTERHEIAATFVWVHALRASDGSSARIPRAVWESAAASLVDWPEHGRPRTIVLEREPTALSLATAREKDLAVYHPRRIEEGECDASGNCRASAVSYIPYRGKRISAVESEWLFETEDGRFGMADLETRLVVYRLPRIGERVQSFRAEVEIGRKTYRRSYWVFNLDTGKLLMTTSVVGVALDLEARRAVEIPPDMRKMLEIHLHPALA